MIKDRPHSTTSAYKPEVVRRNSLSEVSFQLSETVSPSVPPEVCRPTVGHSFSEDSQPPSPLRRRRAQKGERSGNSPKRIGIQIRHSSKPTSPTNQKSFEYSNSLPNSKISAEVNRTPIPTHPVSRSSHCQETPPLSPHDARSSSLPGATAYDQPPEKSSRKRTPGRRRSKKMNKWTAKGVSHVCCGTQLVLLLTILFYSSAWPNRFLGSCLVQLCHHTQAYTTAAHANKNPSSDM